MNKGLNKNRFSSIVTGLIIIMYLSIGFIPNLSAVDKIAPQWVFMTILNGASLLFIAYNQKLYASSIRLILKSNISLIYIGFIIWASLSYFYAINPTEVIVNITRQVNVLFMYLLMGIFLFSFNQKIQFICWIIVLIIGVEVYAVIKEAQTMITTNGIISPGYLKGVTANRNIAAFSIAIKIPFVLYLITIGKKKTIFLGITVITLAFTAISMIQSRASYLAVLFMIFSYSFLLKITS